jgi:pyridinium-3,5-biscarboxylic acid mononucleotide synthase
MSVAGGSAPDGHGWSRDRVAQVLRDVAAGEVSPERALGELAHLPVLDLGYARIDTHRELRQDAAEAVLAEGKTAAEVAGIVRSLCESGAGTVLVTRADAETRAAVLEVAPDGQIDERARLAWVARRVPEPRGHVAMLGAGTSDGPAIREAQVRAELLGTRVRVHLDVGVAGLHRLVAVLPDLARADCVVVAAGMDAALASVVGGLTEAPVVGLPTSVGYGATFDGLSALLSMLVSCAAGVAVVNIDDGFGAGTIAALIARRSGARAAEEGD